MPYALLALLLLALMAPAAPAVMPVAVEGVAGGVLVRWRPPAGTAVTAVTCVYRHRPTDDQLIGCTSWSSLRVIGGDVHLRIEPGDGVEVWAHSARGIILAQGRAVCCRYVQWLPIVGGLGLRP